MIEVEASLICNDVTVTHGDIVALDAVSVSVQPGERVALIGQSGAGKSTLLNAAAGLVTPTSGAISVLGSSVGALRGAALRKHRQLVGLISQDLGLAPALRVVHSVNGGQLGSWSTGKALGSLIRANSRAEVEQVLDLVGLADRIEARTGDLSGGEQQRVAVARTLLQNPRIILADEPTSSVDPDLADRVMGLLCGETTPSSNNSPTVILSVHDPELALRHVDRIIALQSGRIIFDQPVAEVSPTAVASLYERG